MTTSLLVKVDILIEIKRLVRMSFYPSRIDLVYHDINWFADRTSQFIGCDSPIVLKQQSL